MCWSPTHLTPPRCLKVLPTKWGNVRSAAISMSLKNPWQLRKCKGVWNYMVLLCYCVVVMNIFMLQTLWLACDRSGKILFCLFWEKLCSQDYTQQQSDACEEEWGEFFQCSGSVLTWEMFIALLYHTVLTLPKWCAWLLLCRFIPSTDIRPLWRAPIASLYDSSSIIIYPLSWSTSVC